MRLVPTAFGQNENSFSFCSSLVGINRKLIIKNHPLGWFFVIIKIMNKIFILILSGVFLIYAISFFNEDKRISFLEINGQTLRIEVADTDSERMKGLSGRENIGENEGLLFVFEKEGNYGFWMKDMNFPIDIAWINKDKKIINIEKNVSPDTYPKVFYGSDFIKNEKSLYVLETSAGFFEKNKIEIGDVLKF